MKIRHASGNPDEFLNFRGIYLFFHWLLWEKEAYFKKPGKV
jgi:hypothetical protein